MSEREVARKTFGTKLKRGEVYVARLTNIDPPELKRDDKEVTDHDSPDGTKEFIPGLKDGGEVPLEGNLIPTDDTQTGLLAAVDIDEPEPWTIEFPTKPKLHIHFNGYVNAFKVGAAPVDGVLTFSSKIKVTGKPQILTDTSTGLTDLIVSEGDLAPAFDGGIYEYFVTVENTEDSIKVTPTAASHTITVNGVKVTSGSASGNIDLAEGEVTLITIRAWEEGKAPVVYVIKVYREAGE